MLLCIRHNLGCYDQRVETQIDIKSDVPYRLKQIEGDALELKLIFTPGTSKRAPVRLHLRLV